MPPLPQLTSHGDQVLQSDKGQPVDAGQPVMLEGHNRFWYTYEGCVRFDAGPHTHRSTDTNVSFFRRHVGSNDGDDLGQQVSGTRTR